MNIKTKWHEGESVIHDKSKHRPVGHDRKSDDHFSGCSWTQFERFNADASAYQQETINGRRVWVVRGEGNFVVGVYYSSQTRGSINTIDRFESTDQFCDADPNWPSHWS